jgi:uncharacterized repeat protein (TIGR01451 family)
MKANNIVCAGASIFLAFLLFLLPVYSNDRNAAAISVIDGERPGQAGTAVSNLHFDDNGLRFTLSNPPLRRTAEGVIQVEGLPYRIQEPGAPALPFYSTWIVLPPASGAQVHVVEEEVLTGTVPTVQPAPEALPLTPTGALDGGPAAQADAFFPVAPGSADPFRYIYQSDPAIYGRDAHYPAAVYTLSEPVYYRDVRLARLTLYPLRYNPVSGAMRQAQRLEVTLTFEGEQTAGLRPAPSHKDVYGQTLAGLALNYEQAGGWRALPAEFTAAPTTLPVGTDVYKIEVNQDAIYQVTYEDLAAAGMDVANVDPQTFSLSYRGEPVAYQFVGNPANGFQPGEAIRFYGWAFAGSRLEKQFVENNVFWLWAGGTPLYVGETLSQSGYTPAESFQATVTREPENVWFASWTHQWDSFPNEADAWYWDRLRKTSVAPITQTYTVTLPYPAAGPDALFTAEFTAKSSPSGKPHIIQVGMNDRPEQSTATWFSGSALNFNITGTVPLTAVVDGVNTFQVVLATEAAVPAAHEVYLNRISVDYRRRFVAEDDQLIFRDEVGGQHAFNITGFEAGSPPQVLIWNISQPRLPVAVSGAAVSGTDTFTYTFGSNHPAGTTFIASHSDNVRAARQISRYVPPNLDPASSQADWIAISHTDFITETQRLAGHRQQPEYGGLRTHIVNIDDVINQYGYGLPLPAAVRDFLAHSLANWQVAPTYVVMVGDATLNPRHLSCPLCPNYWNPNERQFVLTDLVFKDRWQGQVPSDAPFVHLVGDDLLPDMAIGRIAVQTPAQAAAVINKIIDYEQNLRSGAGWLSNILFIADRPDTGAGNFCILNQAIEPYLAAGANPIYLCLPAGAGPAHVEMLRQQMFTQANKGVAFLNYRGHGSVATWGAEILSADKTGLCDPGDQNGAPGFCNSGKPTIFLSLDCLDGYFVLPGRQGLGETYLRLPDRASAAHWSSTGLGLTWEHSVLQKGFYEGMFAQGQITLGAAVNFAKLRYSEATYHSSLLYTFLLQGDPALQVTLQPLAVEKTALQSIAAPGDQVGFTIEVTVNSPGIETVTVTDTLPANLSYVSATSTTTTTIDLIGNDVVFGLQFPAASAGSAIWEEQGATITLTVAVHKSTLPGIYVNVATATTPDWALPHNDTTDSVEIMIVAALKKIFLPVVRK